MRKSEGDEVPAGSRNADGVLVLRCLRVADDSTPARIAKLTAEAQGNRPQLTRFVDRFGEQYSRFVLAASFALATVGEWAACHRSAFARPCISAPIPLSPAVPTGLHLLGHGPLPELLSVWVYRSLGFMTAASPCALVVAPLAYVSTIAMLAQRGVLVKVSDPSHRRPSLRLLLRKCPPGANSLGLVFSACVGRRGAGCHCGGQGRGP